MTYYIKQGNTFSTTAEDNIDIRKELPVGTYVVRFHPEKGYYLEMAEDLVIKGKVYGNLIPRAERIISTFESRPRNTGVLLNGEKGSGKTLLTKKVSELMNKRGVSTLIVNQQYAGDGFNTFLQSIDQPTVVIFDEFEKVYEPENQEKILTLLDGVFPSKKLFMLTVNNMQKVDQFMINRPGRLFYSVEYAGLDREFIVEYCNDVLINKEYAEGVANLASLFRHFNFDMLQSLVEEMNRYGESPKEALSMLNIKPDTYQSIDEWEIHITIPGWDNSELFCDQYRHGKNIIRAYSPLGHDCHLGVWLNRKYHDEYHHEDKIDGVDCGDKSEDSYPKVYRSLTLQNTNIAKMDSEGGFLFRLPDGVEVSMRRLEKTSFDYRSMM